MAAPVGENSISNESDRIAGSGLWRTLSGGKPIFSFFILTENGLDALTRITGLLTLYSCWEIFKRLNWLREEYQVETWWLQDWSLSLPDSELIATALLYICAASACFMVAGAKGKWAPIVAAICLAYVTSLDVNIAFPHSFFLNIWLCLALSFRRAGGSSSRRLVQIALFSCYALSALQKLFTPEFLSGNALAALRFGSNLQPWAARLASQIPSESEFWRLFAFAVVFAELFFAFGLLHERTRKYAVAGIIVFQSLIFLSMDPHIAPLHLTIFACCLAFYNPFARTKKAEDAASQEPGLFYKALTVFAAAALLAIPLRIYFYPGAFQRMSMLDRRPWTFCMFVTMEGRYKTSIVLKKRDGSLVWLKPRGRMEYLSSDTDLYALAKYLEKVTPQIEELKIETQYEVGIGRKDHKVLTGKADSAGRFHHHIAWHCEPNHH